MNGYWKTDGERLVGWQPLCHRTTAPPAAHTFCAPSSSQFSFHNLPLEHIFLRTLFPIACLTFFSFVHVCFQLLPHLVTFCDAQNSLHHVSTDEVSVHVLSLIRHLLNVQCARGGIKA